MPTNLGGREEVCLPLKLFLTSRAMLEGPFTLSQRVKPTAVWWHTRLTSTKQDAENCTVLKSVEGLITDRACSSPRQFVRNLCGLLKKLFPYQQRTPLESPLSLGCEPPFQKNKSASRKEIEFAGVLISYLSRGKISWCAFFPDHTVVGHLVQSGVNRNYQKALC